MILVTCRYIYCYWIYANKIKPVGRNRIMVFFGFEITCPLVHAFISMLANKSKFIIILYHRMKRLLVCANVCCYRNYYFYYYFMTIEGVSAATQIPFSILTDYLYSSAKFYIFLKVNWITFETVPQNAVSVKPISWGEYAHHVLYRNINGVRT